MKIKKETRHLLFIICNCILAVTLIVGVPVLAVYKTFYEMPVIHNDTSDYTQGRYLNYAGGDLISDFIPKYDDLGEYKNISFNYEDRRKKTLWHKYFISFVFDVEYDKETYLNKKSEIEKNAIIKYDMVSTNYTGIEIESPQNVIYGIYFLKKII